MDIEIIGNRIAELRKARGLTQTELARRLKVSYQAVSKWENGKNLPDFGIIDSLAEELGVTMTELLGLEDKTDDEVLEEIISTSEKKKAAVKEIVSIAASIVMFAAFMIFVIAKYRFLRDNPNYLALLLGGMFLISMVINIASYKKESGRIKPDDIFSGITLILILMFGIDYTFFVI